jgi:chromosome segregation ATPase
MSELSENETPCGEGCHRIEVPSEKEVEALNAMREIKKKVRELRKAISLLSAGKPSRDEGLQCLESKMECLKKEWKDWEEKRTEAARTRMILLGHEKP